MCCCSQSWLQLLKVECDIGGMSVGGFASFVGDFSVEFVCVEELSKYVGKSSVEVRVVIEKGVEVFRCEGQIGNGRFVGHFYSQVCKRPGI